LINRFSTYHHEQENIQIFPHMKLTNLTLLTVHPTCIIIFGHFVKQFCTFIDYIIACFVRQTTCKTPALHKQLRLKV